MKGFYVYMFLNKEEVPLYIGLSINLAKRIESNHFGNENGNLSKSCLLETHKILYHKACSLDDMKIKERYLINKLEPKYNKSLNNSSRFSFKIEIEWQLYSIDKILLLEKQRKVNSNRIINYNADIVKTQNSWLSYGVRFNGERIKYLGIKLKNKRVNSFSQECESNSSYLLKLNGEIYINNYANLSYYVAYYKKLSRVYGLDVSFDFLNVIAPSDNKLFDCCSQNDDLPVMVEGLLEGVSFIRYKVVKQYKWLDERLIKLIDSKLKKYSL